MVMTHILPFHRALLFSSLLLLLLNQPNVAAISASESSDDDNKKDTVSSPTTTLREYLVPHEEGTKEDLYLAMGPAFFGFYGYFGMLAGIEDELSDGVNNNDGEDRTTFSSATSLLINRKILRGVSGASAGAMAAILLAAGISPHRASEFVSTLGLTDFADLGGVGAVLKGDKFESIMSSFLQSASPIMANVKASSTIIGAGVDDTATTHSQYRLPLGLEDALIPVAVSAVDIQPQIISPGWSSWLQSLVSPWSYIASTYLPSAKILIRGSMARAARASACFPGLFEPVGWIDRSSTLTSSSTSKNASSSSDDDPDSCSYSVTNDYSLLIDGGIFDWAGYNGLKEIINTTGDYGHGDIDNDSDNEGRMLQSNNKIRVLNMVVGGFGTDPPGPDTLSKSLGVTVDSVLSLSITGLPNCGPLTMSNGPHATRAARVAIWDAIDRPIVSSSSSVWARDGTGGNDDHQQNRQHHFVLEIDASSFVDKKV